MHKELLFAAVGAALSLLVAHAAPVHKGTLAHRIITFRRASPAVVEKPAPAPHPSAPREVCAGGEMIMCYTESESE